MTDIQRDEVAEIFTELLENGYEQFTQASRPVVTGIQGAQYRLLFHLNKIPMDTMTNMGKVMYISKQHMTTLVDSLIREECVERLPDPDDRRIVCVRITDTGRKKLGNIRIQIKKNISDQIEKIQPEDFKVLYDSACNFITISNKYR